MHSDPVAVSFENVQIYRQEEPLYTEPLCGQLSAGVLNIVTGENGSGKTTLLDFVALRVRTSNGVTVRWTGCDAATDIAYLPQQLWEVMDIRIGDLLKLALGSNSGPHGLPKRLADILKRPTKELGALSGGQRQFFLFWLVSSQDRRAYIYDEPLRHLDPVAGGYVTNTIEAQVRQGRFVAVTEHSSMEHWNVPCERFLLGAQSTSTGR